MGREGRGGREGGEGVEGGRSVFSGGLLSAMWLMGRVLHGVIAGIPNEIETTID
jgi:hypothetical protein